MPDFVDGCDMRYIRREYYYYNDSIMDFDAVNIDYFPIFDNLNSIVNLDTLGIQTRRNSMHKKTNKYGYRLIELCKNTNLFIANGRIRGDSLGRFTCKGSSVVDYFIMSPEIICKLSSFKIDFDPLCSDAHNLIHATFKYNLREYDTDTVIVDGDFETVNELDDGLLPIKIVRPRLTPEHKIGISQEAILPIEQNLNNLLDNTLLVDMEAINEAIDSINNLLINSAKLANCYPHNGNKVNLKSSITSLNNPGSIKPVLN